MPSKVLFIIVSAVGGILTDSFQKLAKSCSSDTAVQSAPLPVRLTDENYSPNCTTDNLTISKTTESIIEDVVNNELSFGRRFSALSEPLVSSFERSQGGHYCYD